MKLRCLLVGLAVLLLVDVGWSAKPNSMKFTVEMAGTADSATTVGADTFELWRGGNQRWTPKSLWGFVRIGPPSVTTTGIGDTDSLIVILKTYIDSIWTTIDSQRKAIGAAGAYLPVAYTVPSDTVLGSRVMLIIQARDSTNEGLVEWEYGCLYQLYISTSPDE